MTDQAIATSETEVSNKVIPWAELVLFISDMKYLNMNRVRNLSDIFHKVSVLAPAGTPEELPEDVQWKQYHPESSRAEIWNNQLKTTDKEWVLFIEDDEEIKFTDFPQPEVLNEKLWAPALINREEGERVNQFYQIRLVYNTGEAVFQGRNLPDCTHYITSNGIELLNTPVQLDRSSQLFENVDPNVEFSIASYAPQTYLVEGHRYFKEGKYNYAAAQYRQLLKAKKLLPFDRLAAVNGLASCMAERFKWANALSLTEQSLQAESLQNIPNLIEYRIYQLKQQWDKAFEALSRYHESLELHTRSSFDVKLSEEETLINLADLALKSDQRERASEYLNEFFKIKNGDVDPSFVKKLLVLCIDLHDKSKSEFYFTRLFEGRYPDQLDQEGKEDLNDFMSLFMKNEWYEFVYNIYNELFDEHPDEDEFRRRLIVVSMKTNRLEQARRLAAKVA
ncbi:hypothetical protein SAMN06265219_11951 [Gracilimonas mengyeensis]|uniref:Tetratricopeptide repeat-containing protein n=2 Tax=Gracilimonas mengyeensis TaxID=1302730 RepID=A0A521FI90_9BACT|nr:hypothetical protein SAMN06265219_11951 [Gracilimonas mengyeensis]